MLGKLVAYSSVLGIDLGGTKISAGLVSNQQIVGQPQEIPTPHGATNIIESLIGLIRNFQAEGLIMGVGIATAGIVNPESGAVIGSTGNLPGWEDTPIKKIIEEKAALRVVVENDANAAAYGECCAANLKKATCLVAVTLGTGIGVGIVIEGKLYRGAHFAGGEGGHVKISMSNSRHCTCGLWDCWEAYGSGRGLLDTAREMLSQLTSNQSQLVDKQDKLAPKDIFEAANSDDLMAKQIVSKWHEHVACGMVALCHVLDPDCFVLSGGLSKRVNLLYLKELLADRTLPDISEKLDIRYSSLGKTAGIIGAAQLVFDAIENK